MEGQENKGEAMNKILEVDVVKCDWCPLNQDNRCKELDRKFTADDIEAGSFPSWCPLPEVEEGKDRCSFCGRGVEEARTLVARSPDLIICDSCILKCVKIVAQQERKEAEQYFKAALSHYYLI